MTAHENPSTLNTLIVAGLAAGVLDILAAIIYWALNGVAPLRILQGIAGGVLGRATYDGGWMTGMLGLLLHFAIMIVIAALYVNAERRLPRLAAHWLLAGTLFGVVVYAVMNAIVLPLSAFPHPVVFSAGSVVPALLMQIAFVGWPIAFLARPRA